MNTNTNQPVTQETYGFLMNPPDALEGDEHEYRVGHWEPCMRYSNKYSKCICKRRRRIQPGEGYRIVEWDEVISPSAPVQYEATTYGNTWFRIDPAWRGMKIEMATNQWPKIPILAIRVPVAKKDEWPKNQKSIYAGETWTGYRIGEDKDFPTKFTSRDKKGQLHSIVNTEKDLVENCQLLEVTLVWKTPSEAAAITGEKDLGQAGSRHVSLPAGSSPVPVDQNMGGQICECGHSKSSHDTGWDACGCMVEGCKCRQFKPRKPRQMSKRVEWVVRVAYLYWRYAHEHVFSKREKAEFFIKQQLLYTKKVKLIKRTITERVVKKVGKK